MTSRYWKKPYGSAGSRQRHPPHDHPPHRAVYLNSLGGKLANLFEVTGRTQAREEACRHFGEAAGSTTGDTVTRIKAYRRFAFLASGPDAPRAGGLEAWRRPLA